MFGSCFAACVYYLR
uniref:Uncharacterized protein n=1 Tax=Arundo donax TaxID=35708 RepID=A0A0A8XZW8_ARUDO